MYDKTYDKFTLYGALWAACARCHSGQGSRGYRILSLLGRVGYKPGLTLQRGEFEDEEQERLYGEVVRRYGDVL